MFLWKIQAGRTHGRVAVGSTIFVFFSSASSRWEPSGEETAVLSCYFIMKKCRTDQGGRRWLFHHSPSSILVCAHHVV